MLVGGQPRLGHHSRDSANLRKRGRESRANSGSDEDKEGNVRCVHCGFQVDIKRIKRVVVKDGY